MNRGNYTQTLTFDPGEWRPRYWTLASVSIFHLILAATLITATPKLPEPTVFNAVDVVTFPDGTTSNPDPQTPAEPVELTPPKADPIIPLPNVRVDPKFGPRPTDRRTPPTPVQKIEPTPPTPLPVPEPVLSQASEPEPPKAEPIRPRPVPLTPAPQASPLPKAEAVPKRVPEPIAVPVPVPVTTPPLAAPSPTPVPARQTPPTPTLVQPPPTPLNIRADKLKVNQNPAIKPAQVRAIPSPAPPTLPTPVPGAPINTTPGLPKQTASPTPKAAPSPPAAIVRAPSPPPPAFVGAAPAPLAPARDTRALPKVQVPRVRATDLRLPEAQAAGPSSSAATSSAAAGVTSLAPGGAPSRAANGGGAPSSGGSGGSGGTGGTAGGSGQAGGGAPIVGGAGGAGGAAGGPSGILPRRPGGASVREAFPRSDGSLLGRMDQTFDCSRIGRDRDPRCPDWAPMEGRNSRGAATYEVPVPKGITPPRYATGTNPMPPCPPGTPGNQMGLSCLPSRDGPGIPKP